MRSTRRTQPLRIPMPPRVVNSFACSMLQPLRASIGAENEDRVHRYSLLRLRSHGCLLAGGASLRAARAGERRLGDPEDKSPNLSFQGRDRRPRSRSWLHLDLYTPDQQAEVERLVALGARRYPWRYGAGDDFIVLEDPGGAL